jgi:iron-sulfur cluster repair protein YtfE (RIC family)
MSENVRPEPLPVLEMKLVHDVHRAATSLLAASAERGDAPQAELAELRDFVVAALRHHHQSEDDALWPICEAVDPEFTGAFRDLRAEHHNLEAALTVLDAVGIDAAAERGSLAAAAQSVRGLMDQHLAHEEPLTFPALRLLSSAQWAQFSRAAMESAPSTGAHLQIGLMDEVGDPDQVAAVLAGLPAPAAQALPVLRDRARTTLSVLRTGQQVAS